MLTFPMHKSFRGEMLLALVRDRAFMWRRALEHGTARRLMIESLVAKLHQALRDEYSCSALVEIEF